MNDFNGKGFDANKLHLWKVDIPTSNAVDDKFIKLHTLESRSHNINDENITIKELGGNKLTTFENYGDIFAHNDSKNIRIIVQPPLPTTTGKWFTSRTRNS
jgi:hypothetical protein